MKAILPLVLLSVSLHAPLMAEDWAAPVTTTSATQQKLIGPPQMTFGRHGADSDLPGYVLGTVSYTNQFDADFDSLDGEVGVQDLNFWTPVLPINLGEFHIITLLGYRATQFDTSSDNNMLSEHTLHSFNLPVVFVHDISEDWIWGGMVMPSYSGDLSSSDNFSISAALGVGHTFNPRFNLFGGIYYSHGFDEDIILPGIGFTWRPTDRIEAFLLPPMGGVSYSINECWILSLIGRFDSPTWHVEADSRGPDRDINYQSLRVGVKLETRLAEHFWAYVVGGVSFARELTIEDLKSHTLEDDEVDAGAYLQAGLNLRF